MSPVKVDLDRKEELILGKDKLDILAYFNYLSRFFFNIWGFMHAIDKYIEVFLNWKLYFFRRYVISPKIINMYTVHSVLKFTVNNYINKTNKNLGDIKNKILFSS